MAIAPNGFTRRITGTGLTAETDGKKSGRQLSEYAWDILTDGTETEHSVRWKVPLPRRGDPHPENTYFRCRMIRVVQKSSIHFEAFAEYALDDRGKDSEDEEENNPLAQPAKVKYGHASKDEAIDQDRTGKPVCTVLGESFDPPISRPFGGRVITVEKNLPSFNPHFYDTYFDTPNTDTFLGYPAGTLICDFVDGDETEEGDLHYFKAVGQFRHLPQGRMSSLERTHWRRVRAEGYYIMPDSGLPVAEHARKKGELVTKPVLHKVSNGKLITDATLAEWYEFDVMEAPKSFLALNLI
jgi:hypothetical protein